MKQYWAGVADRVRLNFGLRTVQTERLQNKSVIVFHDSGSKKVGSYDFWKHRAYQHIIPG